VTLGTLANTVPNCRWPNVTNETRCRFDVSEFRPTKSSEQSSESGIFNVWDTWLRGRCFRLWGTSMTSSASSQSATITKTPWTSSRRWTRMGTASKSTVVVAMVEVSQCV